LKASILNVKGSSQLYSSDPTLDILSSFLQLIYLLLALPIYRVFLAALQTTHGFSCVPISPLRTSANHRQSNMGVIFSQFFPPAPILTEKNLPSQSGKVFIVTGGASRIGYELVTVLFRAGGKLYIAGRSEEKARQSTDKIKATSPKISPNGQLEFLYLEWDDLSTINPAVDLFAKQESKPDILWNNAGVSLPPLGSTSSQGNELQMTTNCLGPYLFTQLLLPLLQAAAQERHQLLYE
jgi:hypothetical protein